MRIDNFAPQSARTPRATSRPGFTLVELMVAMALSLFLMTILAEAFAVSMDTFRGLRALGDMQDTLRTSLRQMREDLSAPHFEGARKLSDPNFWAEPRREGFFYMRGGFPTSEGNDGNTMPSTSAYDLVLHFAVRRRGNRPENYFSVGPFVTLPFNPTPRRLPPPLRHYLPANNPLETFYGNLSSSGANIKSQWAEVAYFLRPIPVPAGSPAGSPPPTTPESNGTVQLFNLYRAELMILPYRDLVPIGNVTGALTYDGNSGNAYMPRIANNALINFISPNDNAMQTGSAVQSSTTATVTVLSTPPKATTTITQTTYVPATKSESRDFLQPGSDSFEPGPGTQPSRTVDAVSTDPSTRIGPQSRMHECGLVPGSPVDADPQDHRADHRPEREPRTRDSRR